MDIGRIIYLKRNEKGLTQNQLAELLGVNEKTIKNWEDNTALPSAEMLKNIAECLGTNIKSFYNTIDETDRYEIEIHKKNLYYKNGCSLIIFILSGFLIGFGERFSKFLTIYFCSYALGLIAAVIGIGIIVYSYIDFSYKYHEKDKVKTILCAMVINIFGIILQIGVIAISIIVGP